MKTFTAQQLEDFRVCERYLMALELAARGGPSVDLSPRDATGLDREGYFFVVDNFQALREVAGAEPVKPNE